MRMSYAVGASLGTPRELDSGNTVKHFMLLLGFKVRLLLAASGCPKISNSISFHRTKSPLRPITRATFIRNPNLYSRPGYSPEYSVSANIFVRFEHIGIDELATPIVDTSVSVPNCALTYADDL